MHANIYDLIVGIINQCPTAASNANVQPQNQMYRLLYSLPTMKTIASLLERDASI